MLKILHLGTSLKGGGAQSVFRDTVLFAQSNDYLQNYVAARSDSEGVSNISIDCKFPLPIKGKSEIISQIYSIKNFRILKKFLKEIKPDIIHFHGYGLLSPSILHCIYLYRKKYNVRVIQTVHTYELLCSHFAGFDYRKDIRCLDCHRDKYKFRIFYRRCSRGGTIHSIGRGIASVISDFFMNKDVVDDFIFPSEFLKSQVENSQTITNANTHLIRNPINSIYFQKKINTHNFPDNSDAVYKFVYFGRLSKEKNIECLLKAAQIISKLKDKNLHFYIIGSGEEEESLKNLACELKIEKVISFIPFLAPNELVEFLKSCHFSVMSSKCYETASLVVVEAVLSGLIPIVPKHGAFVELIEMLNCGIFFASDDYNELANKMIFAIENFSYLQTHIGPAQKIINTEFEQERYITNLSGVYMLLK